jgi:hypothetical protein
VAGTLLTFTLAEAATVLDPPMTEDQLRAIIGALRIPSAGPRYTGRAGRPHPTYEAATLMQLHAALRPWLVTPAELPALMGPRPHARITG